MTAGRGFIALAGVIGQATPPAASGEPFEKGTR